MAEQKYLFEIDINTSAGVQKLAEYERKIQELQKEIVQLGKAEAEGDQQAAAQKQKLILQVQAYRKEQGNIRRELKNTMTAESELYANTLQGLRSQLSAEKDKLRYMELGSEEYQKQIELVNQLNDEVKEAEYSYGVYTRNVGNYGNAMASLGKSLKSLSAAGLVLTGTFGDESEATEEQQKAIKNLSKAVMAYILVSKASASATKSETIAQIASNLAKSIGIDTAARQAKAEAAATAMKSADTIATKAVTAAQWLWNAALAANPIFLLIAAIAAVVAGIILLTTTLNKNAQEQKKLNELIEQYDKQLAAVEVREKAQQLESLQARKAMTDAYAKQIEQMQKDGATAEEIGKVKKAMEKDLQALADQRLQQEIENTKQSILASQKKLKAEIAVLALMREGSKKYKEQADKIKELQGAINGLQQELTNKEIEQSNNRIAQVDKELSEKKAAADKAYENSKTALDNLQKVEKAHFNTRKKYQYDYTKSAEENAKAETLYNRQMGLEELKLDQDQKKAQLALQKKYGKITEKTYKAELQVLKDEYAAYLKDLESSIMKEQAGLLQQAIQLAGGATLEKQLADIEKKYYDAEQEIKKNTQLSAAEKDYYIRKLEDKRIIDLRAATDKFEEDSKKRALEAVNEIYKNDYRMFSQNEIEKTKAEIEQTEARIQALKEAGVSTFEDESKLAALNVKLKEQQYAKELNEHYKSKKEQAEITRKYLEDAMNDENLSLEQRKEKEIEYTEFMQEQMVQRIEQLEQWGNSAVELYSQFGDLLSALGDREVQKAEADNDKKKKSLEKQLKAGLISQKQYDKQVAKADEDLAAKQLKIKRKQAEQEKAVNLMQVIINTAASIAKTAATLGYPAAIPMIALAAAMGAIQTATILAQPLPKAREGMIVGNTHEQGGVVINAEGGERIVAKEPTRAFPELLNLISYIGKNSAIPNTGYAERVLGGGGAGIDSQQLATMIGASVADAIADLNISVSVEAIDNAKTLQTRVENSAKM